MSADRRTQLILVPLVFVIAIGGWQAIVRGLDVNAFVLPAPSDIVLALKQGFASGLLWEALKVTMIEIVLGFILAALSALILGTLISQIRLLEITIYPYIVALQTVPKIAIAPLIVAWVGFGIESKVVIVVLVAFFPMLVNTIVGLKATPEDKIDLMRSLGAPRWKIFYMVQLPEAMPYIFAGLSIGIVLAVLGAIVGEFVGAKAGLGYQIVQMNYNLDIAGVFAVLIVLAIIGIAFDFITTQVRRRLLFWHKELR
ncbi:MAG TPA: ABC transporter permease [Pseudolabrys sp.]|nr:ABC transporter permease [Pseudolabrys sp.]